MLQSGRLTGFSAAIGATPTTAGLADINAPQLSKTLVRKMHVILRELGLPEVLTPTRAVCDLYDQVWLIIIFSLHLLYIM